MTDDIDGVETLTQEELAEAWYEAKTHREEALTRLRAEEVFAQDWDRLQKLEKKMVKLKEEADGFKEILKEAEANATILIDNELTAIEIELLNKFDPDNGFSFETEHTTVKFNKSTKVIVDDTAMVAEVLVKNHKAAEGIKSFSLTKLRAFITTGLLDGAAHLEETIKPKVTLK